MYETVWIEIANNSSKNILSEPKKSLENVGTVQMAQMPQWGHFWMIVLFAATYHEAK